MGRAINLPKGAHEETFVEGCTNKLNSLSFNLISSAVKRRWCNYPSMQLPLSTNHSQSLSFSALPPASLWSQALFVSHIQRWATRLCHGHHRSLPSQGRKVKIGCCVPDFLQCRQSVLLQFTRKGRILKCFFISGHISAETPPKTLHQRMAWLLCHWMCKAWSNVPLLLLQLF